VISLRGTLRSAIIAAALLATGYSAAALSLRFECPLHAVMADWVRRAALRVPGVERVEVTLTFDPPWSPARIAAS